MLALPIGAIRGAQAIQQKKLVSLVRQGLAGLALCGPVASPVASATAQHAGTQTPVRQVVVIFQENVSFDHCFATYPHTAHPAGEPRFEARPGTPTVNGLADFMRSQNPNAANPQRLGRNAALTCDQDHHYGDEQRAMNGGLIDKFVEYTNRESWSAPELSKPNLVTDYYDGNTVTAMWNYAQQSAMSDNSCNTTCGPSTAGALNLAFGQTHGAICTDPAHDTHGLVGPDTSGVGTVINDPDPACDACSNPMYPHVSMADIKKNIGDLLSAKGVTWGWFEGGFRPTSRTADG